MYSDFCRAQMPNGLLFGNFSATTATHWWHFATHSTFWEIPVLNSFSEVAATVVVVSALSCAAAPADDSMVSLFDSKTLEGWDFDPRFWSVENGTITGETTVANPTEHNTFLIWRGGYVDNFELEVEYRIIGGNSGIQYRSFELPGGEWLVGGYQADLEAGDT